MKLNHDLAHKVIDRIDSFHREPIDDHPRGFDMSLWYAEHGVGFHIPESQAGAIECRTSACLAGWTVTLLDSPDTAHSIMSMQTDIYGGIGERFMETASTLLEADDAAREELHDLFCRLSYTWPEAKGHLLHIIDQCEDVS